MVGSSFRPSLIGALLVSAVVFGCSSDNSGSGGSSGGGGSQQSNPVPVLSSINPSSADAGGSATTITATGSSFISSSVVEWNGGALPTSYQSATTLTAQVSAADLQNAGTASISVENPSPGGGNSAAVSFTIQSALPAGVSVVNVAANDLAWDPVHQTIYLSLPGADASNGNSIQPLDPATGNLGTAVFVGGEPNLLSVSTNSEYLYVGLNGASNVLQLALPGLTTVRTISLGSDPSLGPYFALDLQAAPGVDGTFAVVRETPGYEPAESGGVVIYDNGTARGSVLCGWGQGCSGSLDILDSIQWNSDASQMFASNYESTGFDFYTIPVTSAGFGTPVDYPDDVPVSPEFFHSGDYTLIHYDAATKLIYDDDGRVIDPSNGTVVGSFNASGAMVPDGELGLAYFLGHVSGTDGLTLESFNINTFTPVSTLNIPSAAGTPSHLIRWGTQGLAFTTSSNTNSGVVYLISGSFVTSTSSTLAPSSNVQRTWNLHARPLRQPSAPSNPWYPLLRQN